MLVEWGMFTSYNKQAYLAAKAADGTNRFPRLAWNMTEVVVIVRRGMGRKRGRRAAMMVGQI